MKMMQKSLCVFIHFSKYPYIPKYVRIYVNELSNYFDQIILVTNQRALSPVSFGEKLNILVRLVKNEGYDLGMFYKVFETIDSTEYSQIACINDSNVLFNELKAVFDWSKTISSDFWGIIDSNEKPWFSTHLNNYHIQSHFIVFNRKAIEKLPLYFETLRIKDIIEEKDFKKLRKTVINDWEIGLSQFLIQQGLTPGSFVDSNAYAHLYLSGKQANVGHKLFYELIKSGYPLIKKKIIIQSNWKVFFKPKKNWKKIINQFGNQNWTIQELIDEMIQFKADSGNQTILKLKRKFSGD